MKILHRCTGPSHDDPYPCGVWINLVWGWLRIWPLRRTCIGWWASAKKPPTGPSTAHCLLTLKDW